MGLAVQVSIVCEIRTPMTVEVTVELGTALAFGTDNRFLLVV